MTLIGQHHVSHFIAMNESMILRLNSQRFRLEKQCRLLFPPTEIFNLAFNKILTLRVAESIGVPIPKTWYISRFDDLDGCRDMKFPVVLKRQHGDVGSLLKFLSRKMAADARCLQELPDVPTSQPYHLHYVTAYEMSRQVKELEARESTLYDKPVEQR